MAAFSAQKYPTQKTRDLPPENFGDENAESGAIPIGFPRSAGQKYLPIRISTAYFEGQSGSRNPGSSRKTMGLSSRKPIRNIHKLLESPKRTARKRLDNLYDYAKPKENINSTKAKSQVLSAKKIAPKTPVLTTNLAKKSDKKTGLNQNGQNSRHSRLLPPGTIAGTYMNGRSISSKNSISKPLNDRLTLMKRITQSKRPSDVPEESPQPLESSYEFSDQVKKLPLLTSTAERSIEALRGTDSNDSNNIQKEASLLSDPQSEKERLVYCCKCSQTTNNSNPSENDDTSAHTNVKFLVNSKEISSQGLISDTNEAEVVFERPTVIVRQTEASLQINKHNFDELEKVPVQDGSYSEILGLQPSSNSSGVDESLLFKRTEIACTQLDRDGESNSGDKTTEFIFQLISTNNKLLFDQQKYLTDSISQCESNLKNMKLMLESVNAQLDKQKSLESSIKLKGLSHSTSNVSALLLKKNSNSSSEVEAEEIDHSNSSSKEDLERIQGRTSTKQRKSRKSLKSESGLDTQEKSNLAENVLGKLNQDNNEKIENIENEPPQRRRSARLALKNNNLSLPIEQSTPVTEKRKSKITQANSKTCTPSMMTPARNPKWGRRSERPLREYMVLKSAMKFLNTPDLRRYRIGSDEKVQIRDSLDKTDQVLLSDKLLTELHDLYQTP